MNTKEIRSWAVMGVAFFVTVTSLSFAYAALTSWLSTDDKVSVSGTALSSQSWNRIVDSVLELDTKVTAASQGEIGKNQTWTNVTASRSINTNYVNDTGRPIMVTIVKQYDQTADHAYLVVDGVTVNRAGTSSTIGANNREMIPMSAIIPSWSTYMFQSPAAALLWTELR